MKNLKVSDYNDKSFYFLNNYCICWYELLKFKFPYARDNKISFGIISLSDVLYFKF